MNLEFSGEMWFWKGAGAVAFHHVPEEECRDLESDCYVGELWLGHDSGYGSDRGNPVEDVAVPE